jgi:polyvinyl alcohol dehydrogenase (cytochrome)
MESCFSMNRSLFLAIALPLLALGCSSSKPTGPAAPLAGSGAPVGTLPAPNTGVPPTAAGTPMTAGAPAVNPVMPAATGGTGATPVATAGTGASGMPTPGDVPVVGGTPITPATPASTDWTLMGYDTGSTYFNRAETKITKDNVASMTVKFQADMGGAVYGAPLQVGGNIYVSGSTGLRGFDATGKELWKATPGTSGSMSYSDGMLYVNTSGSKLIALNATDGKQLWSKPYQTVSADGTSSPLVAGDLVIVGGSNGGIELAGGSFRGFLSAVDRKTGEMKWSTFTVPESAKGASIWSSPSADLEAGLAFAGTGNNYGAPATDSSDSIVAFDLATGTIKYKAQRTVGDAFSLSGGGPDADFGANPVLYEVMIDGQLTKVASAGDKGGTAHAILRADGKELWKRSLGMGQADGSRGIFTNSTWTGKYMLFALNEGGPATLFALDGATGDIKWMRKLDGSVWGRTAVANGVGFAGVGEKLEAFDVETGALIKSWPSKGGTVASTITVSNGRVAFGEGFTWSNGKAGQTLTVLGLP